MREAYNNFFSIYHSPIYIENDSMFCFAFDTLFDFFTDAPDPSEGRSAGPEEVRFALPGGPWSRAVELAEGFGWLAVRS